MGTPATPAIEKAVRPIPSDDERITAAMKALANKARTTKCTTLWTELLTMAKDQWKIHTPDPKTPGAPVTADDIKTAKSSIQRYITSNHPNEFTITTDEYGVLITRVANQQDVAKQVADQKMAKVKAEADKLNAQMKKLQRLCQEAEDAAALAAGRQAGHVEVTLASFEVVRQLPAAA
jgi:hypothetical protein